MRQYKNHFMVNSRAFLTIFKPLQDLLFGKYTRERSLQGKPMWNYFGEKKKGKDMFSVCVNSEASKTLYIEQACQHFLTMA